VKLELNPHFVLNALNSVSALLYVDPGRARNVVARLGDLLRRTLENSDLRQVPLSEEIHQLRPYVEIEEVRFGSQLRVEWQVDADTLDVPVPHMVLQPLVENAVKHGIGGAAGRGAHPCVARRRHGAPPGVRQRAGPVRPPRVPRRRNRPVQRALAAGGHVRRCRGVRADRRPRTAAPWRASRCPPRPVPRPKRDQGHPYDGSPGAPAGLSLPRAGASSLS
jgi:hypothetical protein